MMLMIPRGAQGISCEISGLLGEFVKGSLQVVELLSLAPCCLSVDAFSVPVVRLQGMNEKRVLAPRQVLRSDSTVPSDRLVEVG
jgi:hypothetical protein